MSRSKRPCTECQHARQSCIPIPKLAAETAECYRCKSRKLKCQYEDKKTKPRINKRTTAGDLEDADRADVDSTPSSPLPSSKVLNQARNSSKRQKRRATSDQDNASSGLVEGSEQSGPQSGASRSKDISNKLRTASAESKSFADIQRVAEVIHLELLFRCCRQKDRVRLTPKFASSPVAEDASDYVRNIVNKCRQPFADAYSSCLQLLTTSAPADQQKYLPILEKIASKSLHDEMPEGAAADVEIRCLYNAVLQQLVHLHHSEGSEDVAKLYNDELNSSVAKTKAHHRFRCHGCTSTKRDATWSGRDTEPMNSLSYQISSQNHQRIICPTGETISFPLSHLALLEQRPQDAMSYIKNADAEDKIIDPFGRNVLHLAAELGHHQFIRDIRDSMPERANNWKMARDRYGLTPVATTVMKGDMATFDALHDPTQDSTEHLKQLVSSKQSLLELAAEGSHCDIVRKMLDYLSSDESHDKSGTMLHNALGIALAQDCPKTEIVGVILAHGTAPQAQMVKHYKATGSAKPNYNVILPMLKAALDKAGKHNVQTRFVSLSQTGNLSTPLTVNTADQESDGIPIHDSQVPYGYPISNSQGSRVTQAPNRRTALSKQYSNMPAGNAWSEATPDTAFSAPPFLQAPANSLHGSNSPVSIAGAAPYAYMQQPTDPQAYCQPPTQPLIQAGLASLPSSGIHTPAHYPNQGQWSMPETNRQQASYPQNYCHIPTQQPNQDQWANPIPGNQQMTHPATPAYMHTSYIGPFQNYLSPEYINSSQPSRADSQ